MAFRPQVAKNALSSKLINQAEAEGWDRQRYRAEAAKLGLIGQPMLKKYEIEKGWDAGTQRGQQLGQAVGQAERMAMKERKPIEFSEGYNPVGQLGTGLQEVRDNSGIKMTASDPSASGYVEPTEDQVSFQPGRPAPETAEEYQRNFAQEGMPHIESQLKYRPATKDVEAYRTESAFPTTAQENLQGYRERKMTLEEAELEEEKRMNDAKIKGDEIKARQKDRELAIRSAQAGAKTEDNLNELARLYTSKVNDLIELEGIKGFEVEMLKKKAAAAKTNNPLDAPRINAQLQLAQRDLDALLMDLDRAKEYEKQAYDESAKMRGYKQPKSGSAPSPSAPKPVKVKKVLGPDGKLKVVTQ